MGIPPASPVAASVRAPCVCRVSVERAKAAPGMHGPGCVGCCAVRVSKGMSLQTGSAPAPGRTAAGPFGLVVAPSPDSDSGPLGTGKELASRPKADVEGQWGSYPLPSTLPGRVGSSTWGWQKAVHWGPAGLAGAAPPSSSQQPLLPTCAEPRGWALGVLDGAMCTAGGRAALAHCNCSLLSSPQESLHQRPPEADSDQ